MRAGGARGAPLPAIKDGAAIERRMKTSTATISATAWSGFRFDGGGIAWAWLTGDSQVRTHISWMGSEPQFRTSKVLRSASEAGGADFGMTRLE